MHWRQRYPPAKPDAIGGRAFVLPGAIVLLGIVAGLIASCQARAAAIETSGFMRCGERAELVERLREKFHETPAGMGLTGQGSVVELFNAPDGGWTLVLSFPNGRSCLLAAGEGWQSFEKPRGKEI